MSSIYGLLNIDDIDADRVFVSKLGQSIVYEAVQQELARINAELDAAISVFVDETTSDHTRRYKLAGGGYMQPRSLLARPADVKASGSWDVAFPLLDFGDALASDAVTLAYMSIKDLNLHLDGIQVRAANTVRREILRALFASSDWSFVDPIQGTLTVKPLANGDSTVYPPVTGSDSEATEDHVLHSGYASASISDSNDPVSTIVAELVEHFDGSDVAVFHNSAQTAKLQALTDYEDVVDPFILPGSATDVPFNLPTNLPGRIRGRHTEGAWVIEWNRIPADYVLGIALDAPKPLIERVDPADTGLPRGVALVARDQNYPLETSFYTMRRGFGVGNRLNGVAMKLDASAYSVPSAYSR